MRRGRRAACWGELLLLRETRNCGQTVFLARVVQTGSRATAAHSATRKLCRRRILVLSRSGRIRCHCPSLHVSAVQHAQQMMAAGATRGDCMQCTFRTWKHS